MPFRFLIAAVLVTLCAIASFADAPNDALSNEGKPSGLTAVLKPGVARIAPGSPLSLTYTVKNPTAAPITLRFASGQRYEMSASLAAKKPIWRASEGKMFNMMVGSLTFAPGESKTFTESWSLPSRAVAGKYIVTAFLITIDSPAAIRTTRLPASKAATALAQTTVIVSAPAASVQ